MSIYSLGEKIRSQQVNNSVNRRVIEVSGGQVKAVYTERNLPIKIAVLATGSAFGVGESGSRCLGGRKRHGCQPE